MPPSAILDVDGTLVDSNDAHAQAWVDAFNEAGMDVSYARVRRAIGMGGDKLLPHVSGLTADSPRGKDVSSRRSRIFQSQYLPYLKPFPRVRDLLQRFAADGYTIVVASSAQSGELDQLLQIAGVFDLVKARTSSDDANRSKPDPDIVQVAMERAGAARHEAIMLGDTPYDVEAAGRAGIAIVGVESGGWGRDDLQGAIEVHPGAAELCSHYDQSVFSRLIHGTPRPA